MYNIYVIYITYIYNIYIYIYILKKESEVTCVTCCDSAIFMVKWSKFAP